MPAPCGVAARGTAPEEVCEDQPSDGFGELSSDLSEVCLEILDYTSIQGQSKQQLKRASDSLPRAATASLGVRITLICTSLR